MLAANALEGAVELGAADEEELVELRLEVLVAVALAVVGELRVVELERVDKEDDREVVLLDLDVVEELRDDEVVVGLTGARVLEVNALLKADPRTGASRLEVSMLLSGAPRTGARVCLLSTRLSFPSLDRSTGVAVVNKQRSESRRQYARRKEADRAIIATP